MGNGILTFEYMYQQLNIIMLLASLIFKIYGQNIWNNIIMIEA